MKNKTMKKILFIISAIFILFTGCEIDKVYDGPWFVHLDKETASVVEANATTYLKVVMSGPRKGSQTVDFTLSGTAVRGVDYDLNVAGTTLTFPEGTGTQIVEITTIDNVDIEGNRTLEFEITSNSEGTKLEHQVRMISSSQLLLLLSIMTARLFLMTSLEKQVVWILVLLICLPLLMFQRSGMLSH